ncbi:MAG TPA: hypothetical protein VN408_27675 [Actinoplanes sp.]|nr:hypothetical protein [Actinoplanes sp.]
MTLTPYADDQVNVYAYGGVYLHRPWWLPVDAFGAVPYFLGVGNFRPLGRTYEWSQNVAVLSLSDFFGVPANIGLRIVAVVAAMLVTASAVWFAAAVISGGRPTAAPPARPIVLLPFAIGAGLIAAGQVSTTVVFSGLYFVSSALVLLVAAWAAAAVGRPRLGVWRGVAAVLIGAAIAGFNEMACLAIPLALTVVTVRARLVVGLPWREFARDSGIRAALLLVAGYLPVLVPVRMIIQRACADGGCYEGSAVSVAGAAATFPHRMVAWLPPLAWESADVTTVAVLSAVALSIVGLPVLRSLAGLPAASRPQAAALAITGTAVLVLGSAVAALNVWMQEAAAQGLYGVGWRDSMLTTVGGSILILAVIGAARRSVTVLALVLLIATGALSTSANSAYRRGTVASGQAPLHNRIAQEFADFDHTAAGDDRRCDLRDRLVASKARANERRLDLILEVAARQSSGQRFCSRAPVWRGPVPLYRAGG